jgi:hypothetical protein
MWQDMMNVMCKSCKPTWHPSKLGKNKKSWAPTVWQINLTKIKTWQNSPLRVHICAHGPWLPSVFPSRWEGEKNKEYKRIPDVSFKRWKGINIILFFSRLERNKIIFIPFHNLKTYIRNPFLLFISFFTLPHV